MRRFKATLRCIGIFLRFLRLFKSAFFVLQWIAVTQIKKLMNKFFQSLT